MKNNNNIRFQCILPIKKLDLALLCENENID